MAAVKAIMKARKLAKEMRNLTKQTKPNPVKTRKAYKLFVEGDDKELYPLFVDAKKKVPQGEFLEANFPDVAFTAPNGRVYVPSKGAKRGKGEKAKGTGDPVIIPDEKTRKKLIEEGYITNRVKRTEDAPFGKVTAVAARPGWHASQMPVATHIGPQDIKITAKEAETLIQAGITPEAIKKRGNQFYVKRRAEDHVYAEVEMADDVDYQSLLAKEGKTDINDRVPVGGSYKYVDGQADSDKWVVGGDMKVNRVLSKEETKQLQNELGVKDLPLRKEVENILGKKFYQGGSVTGDTMEQGVDDYILAKTDSNNIQMNKGGMSTQMELFEDGGLKDEGGMVDEVSGNDVPVGSTREEVRDDIPAQLSEGEFVLPADVVRYHGLEKIMELRDEAKAGLQKMEDMGQMGNSEEATLPDDVPFSMDDLDIEDEDEPQEMSEGGYILVGGKPMPVPRIGGQPLNMQVGGVVTPTATGTYQIPTNISQQPSYFANYQQSVAPFQPFVPPAQQTPVQQPTAGQQQQIPTFQELMPQMTGKRETIEYRNAAGQKLFIPFINGKPIYPIPEGYTRYVAEEEPIAEDKPVTSTTTQVTTGEGESSNDVLSETSQVRGLDNSIVDTNFAGKSPEQVSKSMENLSTSDRGKAVMNALDQAKGTTGIARGLQQLGTAITPGVLAAGMIGQKTLDPREVLSEVGKPNTAALNSILNAYGPSTKGLSPEEIDMQGIDRNEALSQAVYGMSLDKATSFYGATPSFTKGYKNGDIDPTTGATYSHGQAGDPYGVPSYASITDFGKAMAASAKTGFYGSLATAKSIAMDPTKSAKEKEKAIAFGKEITPFFEMEIDTRSDAEVGRGLDAISQDPSVQSRADKERGFNVEETFGPGESTSTGTGTGAVSVEDDLGPGYGFDEDEDSSTSSTGTGAVSAEDDMGPGYGMDEDSSTSTSTTSDNSSDGSDGGSGGGGGKIICTTMNKMYGLPMYSNRVWMRYNKYKKLDNAWELGYHKIFLSLVKKMPTNKYIRKSLEWFANTRTHGLKEEMKGNIFTVNTLVLRPLFSPIVYITGKLVQKGILKKANVTSI